MEHSVDFPEVLKSAGAGLAFLLLFAPGFVSLKVYDLCTPSEPRKTAELLYEIIGYSSITYALLSWYLVPLLLHMQLTIKDVSQLQRTSLLLFIVVPAIIGAASAVLQQGMEYFGMGYVLTTKLAWDWAFSRCGNLGVIVTLTGGEKICGSFANNAFATTYPFDQQLYLDRLWNVDSEGTFKNPILESKGQLIMGKDISSLRFVELPEPTPQTLTI